LTKESWTNVLFGFRRCAAARITPNFRNKNFCETFERVAFDPANANRDLLVLMMESYAEVVGVPLERIKRWVEKTPANRNYVPEIFNRFPKAKLLLTMRDPRALLAAQIALESTRKTRRFSVYYVVAHWRAAAKLARKIRAREIPGLVVGYEDLALDPKNVDAKGVRLSRDRFRSEVVLNPTRSAVRGGAIPRPACVFFPKSAPRRSHAEKRIARRRSRWVEWHCRHLMPEFRLRATSEPGFAASFRKADPRRTTEGVSQVARILAARSVCKKLAVATT